MNDLLATLFIRRFAALIFSCAMPVTLTATVHAQSVCLPAPRLLTTMPMGGQAGTDVEITIAGEHLDDAEELSFSHPGLTATHQLDDKGQVVVGKYVLSIAADCPEGIHEARVMTRLGVSTSRVFSVGTLPETIRDAPNTTLDTAFPIALNTVCNATASAQAVDHYSFEATKGQRIAVECSAQAIDSRLTAVVSVADTAGNDLHVERRGRPIDFTAPEDGRYVVKIHDLTFGGGAHYFYRLALKEQQEDSAIPQMASTRAVHSFSWPPPGLNDDALVAEVEPNDSDVDAQKISLPCDIAGSFFPAADVDTFEFFAKKGDVWWVEVASERLGLPTDPSIVVQHVDEGESGETLTDLTELNDIASPVKVSSNGYSYDGPPYNAGSSDILGKIEIQQDGIHRLRILDLFGGTRNEPENEYRLIIRRAAPDFAIVGWALHMNLRNGDRNALSKPIALRGGTTMPIEVVVVRRDGFDGAIELTMDNLPDGVTATGLTIPAGQSKGILLITADQDAPRGLTIARFSGTANINGEIVTRAGHMASMAWPVPDAWSTIPCARLLADIPVSVGGSELAPLTIAAAENPLLEVAAGEKVRIPLNLDRRCEFSGASITLKTFGSGFDNAPAFDVALDAETSSAAFDLAALKTPPGEYTVAFYGSAVAKYCPNPEAAGDQAKTNDIVDIIVSSPVHIRVTPKAEQTE